MDMFRWEGAISSDYVMERGAVIPRMKNRCFIDETECGEVVKNGMVVERILAAYVSNSGWYAFAIS